MIKSVSQTPLYALLSADNNIIYDIPPYQREYSWGKDQWDALFDDLLEEDSDTGHFLGTIICVNKTQDAAAQTVLELVDGQQRMTTLSLFLLALYKELSARTDQLDEDQKSDLTNLRRMLCLKDPTRQRLQLQKQNNNSDDYVSLLVEAGFELQKPKVTYVGVRRISKALVHFGKRITSHLEITGGSEVSELLSLYGRVKRSILVKLEVENHSDAFVLFESLNNRGLPLTPIDLIKTSLLSVADKRSDISVENAYEAWSGWLEALGDDYGSQERFFRQFYNAFKNDWELTVPGVSIATRSKLIRVYEELLKGDLQQFISRMEIATSAYGRILGNREIETKPDVLDDLLLDLSRAQGAPAHMLLLFLLVNLEKLGLSLDDIAEITKLLTNFSVRRNLTNTPPTYDLDRIFMSIIDRVSNFSNAVDVRSTIREELVAVSASDDVFATQLRGPVYDDNSAATRFILVALAKESMTKESLVDLWAKEAVGQNKEQFVWTIEHILPQGENLPKSWIEMLGGKEEAASIQRSCVHNLGNLTITGFNGTLGNKSFEEKKERKDQAGRPVGYRNGLALNADLLAVSSWSKEQIDARTNVLVQKALSRFTL